MTGTESNSRDAIFSHLEQALLSADFSVETNPDPAVPGSDGSIGWYDYNGDTFRENSSEQEAVDAWLAKKAGELVGCPITIIRQRDGNGHCRLWYKKT